MHIDPALSVAGLVVGVLVGLTGMGGGALMTPILVLLFNVNPAAAVSSDLVTSLFMKPVGGAVHWRRATVHRGIVTWLLVPAVPSAFAGVFVLNALGNGAQLQDRIKLGLGAALLMAVTSMLARQLMSRGAASDGDGLDLPVRRLPTLLVGLLGGLVVGMTSVGSGSMIIVALMFLYPRLSQRVLVGTNLVQAVPLVGAAAVAHIFFGHVEAGVTGALLIGALPGVFIGAQISSRSSAPWLRPILAAVLLASALKLLAVGSVPTLVAAVVLGVGLIVGQLAQTRRVRAAAVELPETSVGAAVTRPLPGKRGRARDTAQRADLSKV